MNDISVGIEMFQDSNGGITEATIASAVLIGDVLTRELGIQRQFPSETAICTRFASPFKRHKYTYIAVGKAGKDYCVLLGPRNLTLNRGVGDPGDLHWHAFSDAYYLKFDVDQGNHLEAWYMTQSVCLVWIAVNVHCVPVTRTSTHLHLMGIHHGIWVPRPGDAPGEE